MDQAIEKKILNRIRGKRAGWAFSQKDFADLGSRSALDASLHRMQKSGSIRRVLRGIYDYPRFSDVLQKPAVPDLDQVADALARKFGWRIQPDGATAQNLLGLSTQVPARIVYLSDGPNRKYQVGNTMLTFERAALKEAAFRLRESRMVVQALRAFGEDRIPSSAIRMIRQRFGTALLSRVLKDTKYATGWVYAAIQEAAKQNPDV